MHERNAPLPHDEPDRLPPELRGTMWADLFTSELAARSAQHHVTRRALTYLAVGLPLAEVLDSLRIDGDAWTDRVEAYEAWCAENRAAADRMRPIGVQ